MDFSDHFISGEKSNDPPFPNYVTSIFKHLSSPFKRKHPRDMERYERFSQTNKYFKFKKLVGRQRP